MREDGVSSTHPPNMLGPGNAKQLKPSEAPPPHNVRSGLTILLPDLQPERSAGRVQVHPHRAEGGCEGSRAEACARRLVRQAQLIPKPHEQRRRAAGTLQVD